MSTPLLYNYSLTSLNIRAETLLEPELECFKLLRADTCYSSTLVAAILFPACSAWTAITSLLKLRERESDALDICACLFDKRWIYKAANQK